METQTEGEAWLKGVEGIAPGFSTKQILDKPLGPPNFGTLQGAAN